MFLERVVDFGVDLFLESYCVLGDLDVLLVLLVLLLVQSGLVLVKDSKERLVVNTTLVIFPEVVQKFFNVLLSNLKFQTFKDVSKVFSTYDTSIIFINDLEEIADAVKSGSLNCLEHLVNDLFLIAAHSYSVSLELLDEFFVVDKSVIVCVDRVH